jgi:hypothetical protein
VIIAIVALIVALTGTAIAGGGFLTKKKFNKFKAQVVKGPVQYASSSVNVPNGADAPTLATANCPAGTKVLGGGATTSVTDSSAFIDDTGPTGTTGWEGKFENGTGASYTGTVTAICAASP